MSLFRPLVPIQPQIGQNVLSIWNTYADMVAGVVTPVTDGLYGVRTTTGVIGFRKFRGLWRYTGSAFEWFSDFDTEFTDAQFKIHGGVSGIIQFMATLLTGLRQFILPDRSGTIALLDDFDQIQLSLLAAPYSEGQLSYDPVSKTLLGDTGFSGVRVNIGQETQIRFFNNTGVTITNGTLLNAGGVNAANDVIEAIPADSSDPLKSLALIGLATANVLDGEVGIATILGDVRDFDTSLLSEGGALYCGVNGALTQTRPIYPSTIAFIGTVVKSDAINGIVFVDVTKFRRRSSSKSYSFTSVGLASGLFYKAGFYDFNTDDANLNEGALTVAYGTAGTAYAAHAGIVPSGPGVVVGGGQVGLRVTGIEDKEDGPQQAGQVGIITEDITTLTANTYFETSEKFSGNIVFELYIVSGAPTSYSLDFNYGYAKYEDFQNKDVTITGFEAVWQGNANDAVFDVALLHHKPSGWTYAAAGFLPGNGDVARKSTFQSLAGNVTNGQDGAFKAVNLNTFMNGNENEGVIIEVSTTNNSTIQTMDLHIDGVSEEISR